MSKSYGVMWHQAGESFAPAADNDIILSMGEPEGDTNATRPIRNAGTFRNLRTRVPTNGTSATSNFYLQESNVDTAVSTQYATTETGDKIDTDSEAFDATDDVRIRAAIGSGGTALICTLIQLEFEADSGTVSFLAHKSPSSFNMSTSSTTYYFNVIGNRFVSSTTETDAEYRVQAPFDEWSDMYVANGTCTYTGDVVARSRIDSTNGNMVLTMAGGTSNTSYEDSSNEDSLTGGEDINYSFTTPADAGGWNEEHTTSSLVSDTAGHFVLGVHGNAERISANLTRFWPMSGSMRAGEEATESSVQAPATFDFTSHELTVNCTRVSTAPDPTWRTRIGGVNGNQSVTTTVAALLTDASNEDTITSTDELSYQVSSTTGNNFDTKYIGVIGTTASSTGGSITGTVLSGQILGGTVVR